MDEGGIGIVGGGRPEAATRAKFLFSDSSLTAQDILIDLNGEKSLAILALLPAVLLALLGWLSEVGDDDVNGEYSDFFSDCDDCGVCGCCSCW